MKIDIVTIFPGYFDALELSLLGKARSGGLLDVRLPERRRKVPLVRRAVAEAARERREELRHRHGDGGGRRGEERVVGVLGDDAEVSAPHAHLTFAGP